MEHVNVFVIQEICLMKSGARHFPVCDGRTNKKGGFSAAPR